MSSTSRHRLFGSDSNLVQRFTTQAIANNAALVSNTSVGTSDNRHFGLDHAQAFTTGSRAIRRSARACSAAASTAPCTRFAN